MAKTTYQTEDRERLDRIRFLDLSKIPSEVEKQRKYSALKELEGRAESYLTYFLENNSALASPSNRIYMKAFAQNLKERVLQELRSGKELGIKEKRTLASIARAGRLIKKVASQYNLGLIKDLESFPRRYIVRDEADLSEEVIAEEMGDFRYSAPVIRLYDDEESEDFVDTEGDTDRVEVVD